ncbi:uncharacterized protein C8A04DRAFT_25846 [Dichotomopilus funicola]|uniref:Uncharacterized protein n=1 Tax=Dichotomopilus funicola TaxID=1934379 RepID=A0AAN6V7V1_9PEZI|nr:hypothetical protein C8A04DRAFT_25846 [Dichotomopilus funicola]
MDSHTTQSNLPRPRRSDISSRPAFLMFPSEGSVSASGPAAATAAPSTMGMPPATTTTTTATGHGMPTTGAATSMPLLPTSLGPLHPSRFPPSVPSPPRTYAEAHALAYRTPGGLYMVPPGWRLALVEHVVLPGAQGGLGARGCEVVFAGFGGWTRWDLQIVPVGSVLAGFERDDMDEEVPEDGEERVEIEVVDGVVDEVVGAGEREEGEGEEREMVDWEVAERELEDFEDDALAERLAAAGWSDATGWPESMLLGQPSVDGSVSDPAAPDTPTIARSILGTSSSFSGSAVTLVDWSNEDSEYEYTSNSEYAGEFDDRSAYESENDDGEFDGIEFDGSEFDGSEFGGSEGDESEEDGSEDDDGSQEGDSEEDSDSDEDSSRDEGNDNDTDTDDEVSSASGSSDASGSSGSSSSPGPQQQQQRQQSQTLSRGRGELRIRRLVCWAFPIERARGLSFLRSLDEA